MRKKIASFLLLMLTSISCPFAEIAHANVYLTNENEISAKRIGGVSLASSIYKTHNEQGETTGDGDAVNHIGEAVGDGGVIYGNASVLPSQYADLSEYNYMIVQGGENSKLRFMVNRIANTETNAEYTYTIGSSGILKIDLQAFFGEATVPEGVKRDCFHLNCIKVPEGATEQTINSIDLFKNETPIMYELTGTGSINASVEDALNDPNAVFYDASSLDNEITLNPVNPNAMISAKEGIVTRENNANIITNNACNNLSLVDKKPFHLSNTLLLDNPANFTMSMSGAGMATIVIPFDATLPDGISAYEVVSIDEDGGEKTVLTKKCESIQKNKPVLIVGSEGEYTFYGFQDDTELPATTGDLTHGLLVGTYKDTGVPDGSYLLQNHSEEVGFYYVDNDINIVGLKPFHAYLSIPSPYARSFSIILDDSATAVTTVKPVSDAPNSAFNFLGQEVKFDTKGFVIINGIKVYNK